MTAIDRLLNIAGGQVGYHETAAGTSRFGQWYADRHFKGASMWVSAAWCDMFVSWVGVQAGLQNVVGEFAYTPSHAQWFKDHGQWGHEPCRGAVVFFDWGGSKAIAAIDHVGYVLGEDGPYVRTIEGNTDNSVMRRLRSRSVIAGYGYPKYPADPPPKPGEPLAWPGRYLRHVAGHPLMHGNDVREWQMKAGRLAVDGEYGAKSAARCLAIQKASHLETDRVVGAKTWAATFKKGS